MVYAKTIALTALIAYGWTGAAVAIIVLVGLAFLAFGAHLASGEQR